jgi:very-short-patch-repair endonuclease
MPTLPEGARELLARQSGVISRQQAMMQGVTRSQVRTRISRGDWERLLPGVFRSTDQTMCLTAHLRAAVLWAEPHAYLSGAAAAWWWQLTDIEPSLIQITVPLDSRRRGRDGIKIVRRKLPWQDRSWCRGVPVTSLALTAVHGAVALGRAGPAMLDRALQREVGFDAVRRAHERNLGCWGSRAAAELLRAASDGAASAAERLLIRAVRKAGIRGGRVNSGLEIAGTVIIPDLTFRAEKIAVEVDGWAWHQSPDRFQRDRERQNLLTAGGWLVLRFTWSDLNHRMPAVIEQIRQALDRRGSGT